MSFMNPWMLLGALGVALPIVAHMLNNFRYKETDWGAMRFLDRSVRVKSHELRVRDVLLMLIRILAVLLLMLAFTKPSLDKDDSMSVIPGEKRASIIIALDVSFSMSHSDGSSTRLERAFNKIDRICEHIQQGDPVSLILLADEHRVVVRNMLYQKETFSKLLREQKVRPESLNIDTIPKRLVELSEGVDSHQKEIYLVTDLQEKDWKGTSTWLKQSFKDLSSNAQVYLCPIDAESDNVAVTNLELVSGVLRRNTTARYRATIHNFDNKAVMNVQVKCKVNNINVDTKTIKRIAANSSETISLFVPFTESGSLKVVAEISKDALTEDNQRRIVTHVRDRVSVLSVEGSADNAGDSSSFLSKALNARDSHSSKKDLQIRRVSWVSFPTIELDDYDVVIISDVPNITEALVKKLNTYVRKGNGLIWFAGKNAKLGVWNEQVKKVNPPLLPAEILNVSEVADHQGIGISLDPNLSDHSICRPLKSLAEDLLSETRFDKVLNVKVNPGSHAVLKLAGSHMPILVEQSLGRGHVFMFTSSTDTSWNNLALTPVFPMLIKQTITYMTGREFEKPHIVGDSLSLIYDDRPDVNDAVFNAPNGDSFKIPVKEYRNQYLAMLEQSQESGFYTAQVNLQSPALPIAVNVDTLESDVKILSAKDTKMSFTDTDITLFAADDNAFSAIDENRAGRVFWRFLLMLGLGLLIFESLLAHQMRRKTKTQKV